MADKTKYTDIGGQAVLEGVMMRSPRDAKMAIAVRQADGSITVECEDSPDPAGGSAFKRLPVVRGVIRFAAMLVSGYRTIDKATKMLGLDAEEPSKFEKWLSEKLGKSTEAIVMGVAMIFAVALAAGLFILLPSFAAQLFKKVIPNRLVVNLLEGAVRLAIFVGYMAVISLLGDIKRFFMYHGAEHKTISCFEAGEALTPENAARHSRFHPRCGTSYLLLFMTISILFFSVVSWDLNLLTRILSRLIFMPLVAGISYEALMYLGRHDNGFARVLRAPGMWLQKLSTREPDAGMLEVAIAAFNACTDDKYKAPEDTAVPTADDAAACDAAAEDDVTADANIAADAAQG